MNDSEPLSEISGESLVTSHLTAVGGMNGFRSSGRIVREAAASAPLIVRIFAGRFLEHVARCLDHAGENMKKEIVDPTARELSARSAMAVKEGEGNVH